MYGNEVLDLPMAKPGMLDILAFIIPLILLIITIVLAIKNKQKKVLLSSILFYFIGTYIYAIITGPSYDGGIGVDFEAIARENTIKGMIIATIIQSIPLVMLIINRIKSKNKEGETKCQE